MTPFNIYADPTLDLRFARQVLQRYQQQNFQRLKASNNSLFSRRVNTCISQLKEATQLEYQHILTKAIDTLQAPIDLSLAVCFTKYVLHYFKMEEIKDFSALNEAISGISIVTIISIPMFKNRLKDNIL